MRNKEENLIHRGTARNLWVVCGLFFSLFSFTYLYIFQRDVITALHYALAHGKTQYNPLLGAIVLTLALWMLQWGLNMLLRFKGALGALSYLPSFLLLGVLTDITYTVGGGETINAVWGWLLPVMLLLFIALSLVVRKTVLEWVGSIKGIAQLIFSNVLILNVGALITIAIGNSNLNFHHELAMEEAIKNGQWSEARKIGANSLETTRTLSALRAFALSQEGVLGEYLFNYPQNYQADGLLFDHHPSHTIYFTADSLDAYLGASRGDNESAEAYLDRIYQKEEGRYTVTDYYLCGLLLDKRLDLFAAELVNATFEEELLPRYYEEAILLYQQQDSTYQHAISSEAVGDRFAQFLERQSQFDSPIEEKNRMRREFGDSYWWYFFYQ